MMISTMEMIIKTLMALTYNTNTKGSICVCCQDVYSISCRGGWTSMMTLRVQLTCVHFYNCLMFIFLTSSHLLFDVSNSFQLRLVRSWSLAISMGWSTEMVISLKSVSYLEMTYPLRWCTASSCMPGVPHEWGRRATSSSDECGTGRRRRHPKWAPCACKSVGPLCPLLTTWNRLSPGNLWKVGAYLILAGHVLLLPFRGECASDGNVGVVLEQTVRIVQCWLSRSCINVNWSGSLGNWNGCTRFGLDNWGGFRGWLWHLCNSHVIYKDNWVSGYYNKGLRYCSSKISLKFVSHIDTL